MDDFVFEKSAFKHGFTERDMLQVINDQFGGSYEMPPSNKGNDRTMFVGLAADINVDLEVGVEYRGENRHIFHARKAKKETKRRAGYG